MRSYIYIVWTNICTMGNTIDGVDDVDDAGYKDNEDNDDG